MILKQFTYLLEQTSFQQKSFVASFFNLLPVLLVVIIIVSGLLYVKSDNVLSQGLILSFGVLLSFILILGIWGTSFERFDLKVNKQKVEMGFNAKIALFSDIHIGRFKDKNWVNKVIIEINKIENLDAVLVAGDWTYWPKNISKKGFMEDFGGLENSRYPIYAVMGNHDVEQPGPKLRDVLEEALTELGIKIIDNKFIEFEKWRLVGIKDLWSKDFNGVQNTLFSNTKTNIALTHQPDITREYDKLLTKPLLTLTGHTHCGQVRIPFLYKFALPTIDGHFDKGWYNVSGGRLFITCGVGEVGLPIRLFNPPTIDVITIN